MAEFNTYKKNRTNEIISKYTSVAIKSLDKYTQLIAKVFNIMELNKLHDNISNLIQSCENDYKDLRQKIEADIENIRMPSEININGGTKKALLVGINYTGTNSQLAGCINDAKNISEKLVESGFQPTNIMTLTDDTLDNLPTEANIIEQFTKLLKDATDGDFIMFTFSGHGAQIEDTNFDETDFKDEVFIGIDGGLIIDGHIKNIINHHMKPGVTLLMLFDCCHSGTIGDLKYNYMSYSENYKYTETKGDVILISGCRDDQTSADAYIDQQSQGAMTYAFLDTLSKDKNITWRQLIQNMHKTLVTGRYKQIPKLSSGKFINIDTKFMLA